MHAKDAWLKSLSVLPLSSSHDEKGSDWPEFLSVERVAELQFPATDQDGPTASEVKDKQGELILAMRHSVDSGQLYAEYDTTLAETEVAVLDSNGESRLVKGMGTVEVSMLPAQVVCDWLRERGLTPSEHLAAWFDSMKVQERSLPNRDMPDLWSEKTASIRPSKEIPRRFAERDFLEGFDDVTVELMATSGSNGRSPISREEAPAEKCAEIATYQQLDVGDWISLTGVGIGKHGRYRITPDSVQFIAWTDEEMSANGVSTEDQQAMWQDNKAPSLDFPCTPDNLLTFIESLVKSNAGDGTFFEVPDAFKNAVAAQRRAPPPSEAEPAARKRPGRKPSNAPELLASILDALEWFASGIGEQFDRQAMPGPLGKNYHEQGSFHWLCAKIDPTFKKAKETFEKQRSGICALGPYAKRTDFYRRALPHIAPKLMGTSSVHSTQERRKKVS